MVRLQQEIVQLQAQMIATPGSQIATVVQNRPADTSAVGLTGGFFRMK